MRCTACTQVNSADSLFCEDCGARLEPPCPSCGTVSAIGAKFCRKCGGPRQRSPLVPVVNLSRLADRDARIGAVLAEAGFFVLKGHGVARSLWDHAYAAAARAFALPPDVKGRYRGPDDGSQRGYSPLRTEIGDGRPAPVRTEVWQVRPEGHRFQNLFPVEEPDFGPRMLALIHGIDAIVERVLAGIDTFLRKPPGYFGEMIRGGDSLLRVNCYPDSTADGTRPRFRAHQDFRLLTLVLVADKPGLEIQARDGSWCPVTPSAAGIVVNGGDILAIESRGSIPSAVHRVVPPERSDGGRISMVYFVSPRPDARLDNGVLTGDFINGRLRGAGYRR